MYQAIRHFTIPILQKDTLEFLGTVTFYFVVSTPFPHPCPMPGVDQKFGGYENNPTIIGHRGKVPHPWSLTMPIELAPRHRSERPRSQAAADR